MGRVRTIGLHPHLVWLMTVRVVVITTILITAFVIHFATGEFFAELNTIYLLVGITYFLTILYVVMAVFWSAYRRQVYVQLLGDVFIISGLVYITGGLVSPFPFLYILAIITGSILLYRRGGFVMASASCLSYWGLVDLMHFNILPPVKVFQEYASDLRPDHFYYSLAITVFGFYSVALMTGYLAENLRKADRAIEDKSKDLDDLSALHRNVITSMMHGLMTTDNQGRVTSSNLEARRVFGVTGDSYLGRSIDEFFGVERQHRKQIELSLATHGAYQFQEEVLTKEGAKKVLGIKVSRILDTNGGFQGYLYLFEDLTDMKRLEREVRLKEQMASLGAIAAGIAHEVRNPLAAMSGSIQMLKKADLAAEHNRLMDIFLMESDRLNRIIEDFLYYARPSEPLPVRCSASKILSQTASLLRNSSEFGSDHEIRLDFGGEQEIEVFADPNQLRQVVWNLCRNALQAMPEGGVLEIKAGVDDAKATWIAFRDEGCGISEDTLEKVFHPFASGFKGGTGLGLAIVYRIMKAHKGEIQMSRNSDVGVTAKITFGPAPESQGG